MKTFYLTAAFFVFMSTLLGLFVSQVSADERTHKVSHSSIYQLNAQ